MIDDGQEQEQEADKTVGMHFHDGNRPSDHDICNYYVLLSLSVIHRAIYGCR